MVGYEYFSLAPILPASIGAWSRSSVTLGQKSATCKLRPSTVHLALRSVALCSATCESRRRSAGRLSLDRTSLRRRYGMGAVVKLVVLGAVVIIVWAAVINIGASVQPLNSTHVASSIILTLAVAVQRINSVQKWLSKPKDNRRDQVGALAQATLTSVCMGRTVSGDLLQVAVHVWEVPLWYRRLFPYRLRSALKRAVKWRMLRRFDTWVIRPALHRVVAFGLKKQPPSGVRFRKGRGLIGVCIANNDRGEYLTINTGSVAYRNALKSANENAWKMHSPRITHNLELEDARKLSHSYGQVLAKVVQDMNTGEAIGCVTISAQTTSAQIFDLRSQVFKSEITDLSLAVSRVIS